jgi:hypothetical protein
VHQDNATQQLGNSNSNGAHGRGGGAHGLGRMVDVTLTPTLVAAARAACEEFLGALVPRELWTLGKTRVFMKDGALESVVRRFRMWHARRLVAWLRGRLAAKR